MIVQGSSTDYYRYGHQRSRAERFEREVQNKNKMYATGRDNEKQSCISSGISSLGSTNLSDHTLHTTTTTNTSVFPSTASYMSSVYSKSDFGGEFVTQESSNFAEQMERLNLLAKYNGINLPERSKLVLEHGEEFVVIKNGFVSLKPKLNLPIPSGKFARWFQVVDPNASIRDDIKMARGVLRKDRFQHPTQLDTYLGVKSVEEPRRPTRMTRDDDRKSGDKDQQYRVKRVRNKLKHWNAMYKQLHDAIASVDSSNYALREKVQHVDQICSIYIGRAERAIDCFYAEPGAHFMLDMVVSLQKKVAEAHAINGQYQAALDKTAIV